MFNLAFTCRMMLSLASIGLVWLPLAFIGRLCAALLPPCCPPGAVLLRSCCLTGALLLRSCCGLAALLVPPCCPPVAVLLPYLGMKTATRPQQVSTETAAR